jgi:hypothetical protein
MQFSVEILLTFNFRTRLEHGSFDHSIGNMAGMPGDIFLWHRLKPVEDSLGCGVNCDAVS